MLAGTGEVQGELDTTKGMGDVDGEVATLGRRRGGEAARELLPLLAAGDMSQFGERLA